MKQLVFAIVLLSGPAIGFAQQASVAEQKKSDHLAGFDWLKQFEGDWETDFKGTMKCRIIGKQWIVNEISFPQGLYTIQTIGFDAANKKFVGNWIDASSSHIWNYDGKLDQAGKVLLLEAKGPDMSNPKKMRQYRDKYEFTSEDEITLESQMLDDNEQWKTFNKGKMTRKK